MAVTVVVNCALTVTVGVSCAVTVTVRQRNAIGSAKDTSCRPTAISDSNEADEH